MKLDLTNLSSEEERYRELVQDDPGNDEAWFMLGQIYRKQQRYPLAKESYDKALGIKEDPKYLYRYGEMLYDTKNYGKAMRKLLSARKNANEKWSYWDDVTKLIDEIYTIDNCSL